MTKPTGVDTVDYTTEGIRYTGSKRGIIPRILSMVSNHCSNVDTILGTSDTIKPL